MIDNGHSLRGKVRGRKGMTLIEVVIAVFIFGICIGGACMLVIQTKTSMDTARDHYVAINIAKNRLEKARTFGFYQLSVFVEQDTLVNVSGAPDPGGDYRRTTTVSNVAANLVEVMVTVQLRDRVTRQFSDRKSETVSTYLADY